MRIQDTSWQGHGGYWQPLFVRENWLPLGHAAWSGFLTQGRGLVACELAITEMAIDWSSEVVDYTLRFVPLADLPAYLATLALAADLRDRLTDTAQTYDPEQEFLLLIQGDGLVEISLLQGLAVSPPECYRQLRDRWPEFTLSENQ